MSRKNNRGRSNPPVQIQRRDQLDHFNGMRQIMRGFGGMGHDDFFGMMRPFESDPFEEMMNFSNLHKNVHQKGKQGSYVCQTFVSSSKMGNDGKIHRQDYFQNNMGEHRGGNTISQKHQAYKNSKGVNRIAEERMLNDKGRKIVREKRGQDIEETNHYYNIDEEEASNFDNDWRRADKNMNFLQNHQKYMKSLGNGRSQAKPIEYNPSVYDKRGSKKQARIENDQKRRK